MGVFNTDLFADLPKRFNAKCDVRSLTHQWQTGVYAEQAKDVFRNMTSKFYPGLYHSQFLQVENYQDALKAPEPISLVRERPKRRRTPKPMPVSLARRHSKPRRIPKRKPVSLVRRRPRPTRKPTKPVIQKPQQHKKGTLTLKAKVPLSVSADATHVSTPKTVPDTAVNNNKPRQTLRLRNKNLAQKEALVTGVRRISRDSTLNDFAKAFQLEKQRITEQQEDGALTAQVSASRSFVVSKHRNSTSQSRTQGSDKSWQRLIEEAEKRAKSEERKFDIDLSNKFKSEMRSIMEEKQSETGVVATAARRSRPSF